MHNVYRPTHGYWNGEYVILENPPYDSLPDDVASDITHLWLPRWYDPQQRYRPQGLPRDFRSDKAVIVLDPVRVHADDAYNAANMAQRFELARWIARVVEGFLVFEKSQVTIVNEHIRDL